MISEMSRNWWLFLVRGLVAILFGALAIIWPTPAWFALVMVFGAFALLDGILTIMAGIDFNRYFDGGWVFLLEGVAGIVIGVLTFIWPITAAHVLFYFIAAWAILTGIFEIAIATQIRHLVPGEWSMILAGILSVGLGILLFIFPGPGLIGIVWLIGIYAVVFGVMQIIFAARLNGLKKDLKSIGVTGI